MAFCDRLNAENRSEPRLQVGWHYVLPTESQWEYACRAGRPTAYCFGETPTELDQYAWFQINTRDAGQNTPTRSGSNALTPSGFMTCTETSGSGAARRLRRARHSPTVAVVGCIPPNLAGRRPGYYEPEEGYNDLGFRVALVMADPK